MLKLISIIGVEIVVAAVTTQTLVVLSQAEILMSDIENSTSIQLYRTIFNDVKNFPGMIHVETFTKLEFL